ncbi:MAG: ComEC/Rec2 family competence protein [Anaerolineae bacterium]|nr:ComEC/Rec2 family competence protein [Anaerolineae bacterium]
MLRRAPLALPCVALALGISLSSLVQPPTWLIGLALGAAGFALMGIIAAGARSRWLTLVCVLLVGAARYLADLPKPGDSLLLQFTEQRVIFEGIVVAEPDARIRATNLTIRPTQLISPALNRLSGQTLVRVRAPAEGDWRYGDTVRVEGRLEAPPRIGRFDYRAYLSNRNVFAWVPRPSKVERTGYAPESGLLAALLQLKDALHTAIQRNLPMPESALLSGVVLGREQLIPESLREAFQETGTAHILAISGANISVLIVVVLGVLWRAISRRVAAVVALGLIWFYVAMVGAPASAVRAAAMASLMLAGTLVWRRGISLNTLCGSVGLILLVDPRLLFDVGFQLSVAATLGLVLFAEHIARPTHRWIEQRLPQTLARWGATVLADGVLITLTVHLTTMPLLLYYFQSLSLTALVANLLILPLQPPLMAFGVVAAVVGAAIPPLGVFAAGFAYPFLTLTIRIVRWIAESPVQPLPVHGLSEIGVFAYYAVLSVLLLTAGQRLALLRFVRQRASLFGWALPISGLVIGALIYTHQPDRRLRVTLSGSSAFVQLPSGERVAFVGDGSLSQLLDRTLPPWDRRLDYVVLAEATDGARQSATSLMEGYRVDVLIVPAAPIEIWEDAELNWAWHQALRNVSQVRFGPPERLSLGSASAIQVVSHAPTLDGAQTLGVRILHGASRLDLVGKARAGALLKGADLVFTAPRAASPTALESASPRWVVWADARGKPPVLRSDIYAIWLREVDPVVFVSDGIRLQRTR